MIIIVYIILGLFGSIVTFLSFSPQFGKNPSKSQKQLYSTFENYKDGAFANIEEAVMITGDMPRGEFFKDVPGRRPHKDFSPQKIDFKEFKNSNENSIKFVWIGHSSFLFNIGGKLIMLDPMFGEYCAPVPIPTLKRFQEIEENDFIVICDVGAYGMSLSSNYNLRPKPIELLIKGSKIKIIRKRQKHKDLM